MRVDGVVVGGNLRVYADVCKKSPHGVGTFYRPPAGTKTWPLTHVKAVHQRLQRVDEVELGDDDARNLATADCEFGLVFNRHLPETVELPGRAVRARDKVRVADSPLRFFAITPTTCLVTAYCLQLGQPRQLAEAGNLVAAPAVAPNSRRRPERQLKV
jgi:hypothetical protein